MIALEFDHDESPIAIYGEDVQPVCWSRDAASDPAIELESNDLQVTAKDGWMLDYPLL